MKIPKIIPKWLFQVISSLFISGYISINIYWYLNNSGLYRVVNSLFGEELNDFLGVVNVLIALLIILAFIIIFRSFAKMPSIRDQLASNLNETNKNKLKSKKEIRISGSAFTIAGIPILLLGAWMLLQNLEQGFFRIFEIMMILLGFVFFIAGIIQILTGKQILKKKN